MKKVKKIGVILLVIVLLPILFVNIVIIAKSYINPDKVPDFMGWKPFITLSGSMETAISTGDLILVKEVDPATLKVGDIIAYREDKETVITHRIIELYEDEGQTKFVTKGDNNNTEDRNLVEFSQVEGKFQKRIPKLGNVAMFLQTPTGILVALSIPALIYILYRLSSRRTDKKYEEVKKAEEEKMKQEIERLKKENEELAKK